MHDVGTPHWINKPPVSRRRDDVLTVVTGVKTDFWNNTFYGFRHADGHFLATTVGGDFSLTVRFTAAYEELYDQAGAMLRVDGENWLKCGVEFTDGARHFSVVVTRDDQSDWSILPIGGALGDPVTLRLTRHGEALRIELEEDGKFRMVRLAFLDMPEHVAVGPMCCSPTGGGMRVVFDKVTLAPPRPRELHD